MTQCAILCVALCYSMRLRDVWQTLMLFFCDLVVPLWVTLCQSVMLYASMKLRDVVWDTCEMCFMGVCDS